MLYWQITRYLLYGKDKSVVALPPASYQEPEILTLKKER